MNFRTTGILFGLVLASSLVLLGMSLFEEGKDTDFLLNTLTKAGLKADDIDTLEFERADGAKMKIVRTDAASWKIIEPIQVKAEAGQITRIVDELFKAKPIPFGDLSSNKATHGLEPPGLKVTLKKGTEHAATVNVGNVEGSGRQSVAFVTTSERPERPMAVPREAVDPLLKDAKATGNAKDLAKWQNDYRTRQVFTISPQMAGEEVTGFTLAGRGSDLTLTRSPDGWKMSAKYTYKADAKPETKGEPRTLDNVDADPTGDFTAGPNTFNGVRPLIQAITGMQAIAAEDFLPDDPTKMAEYGLADGNPDRVKVEIKTKGAAGQPDLVETAYIGKKVEGAPNRVYVKVPNNPGVIRATTQSVDGVFGVLADPSPMRNRNLFPSEVDRNRVAAIDITTAGQTARLRQPVGSFGGRWQLFGSPSDPTDANAETVNKLLGVLFQPRVVKEFPPINDANFAGSELKAEIKMWTDMETPDPKADAKTEPRTKGNPIVVQVGKVTRDSGGRATEVYVRRIMPGGAKADFVLPGEVSVGGGSTPPSFPGAPPTPSLGTPTDVVGALVKDRLNLLSPELKSFSPSQVARLTIAPQNQSALEVSFDDKPDPPSFPYGKWTYARFPAGQPALRSAPLPADANESGALLSALASLTAGPFTKEAPDEAYRVEKGVSATNPVLKVVVNLKAATPPAPLPGQPPAPTPVPEERVYYFGRDESKDGKTYVYAMQEGRNAVFLVDKAIVTRLTGADVRDRTVVRFDRSKVVKIVAYGWYEKNKNITLLVFDKNKEGGWTYNPTALPRQFGVYPVQSPAMSIDPGKVNSFLGVLDGLRAESFLAKEPQNPALLPREFGFAPNEKALAVEIYLEGGQQPIKLNIAAGVKMDAATNTIREFVSPDQAERFVVWVDSAADKSVNPMTVSAAALRPFKENYTSFAR